MRQPPLSANPFSKPLNMELGPKKTLQEIHVDRRVMGWCAGRHAKHSYVRRGPFLGTTKEMKTQFLTLLELNPEALPTQSGFRWLKVA